MSKVRYTIRLYRLHDLDLITFIFTHEFDLMHAVYSAVKAFANNEAFIIKIPPITATELPQLRRVYTKSLILDTEKDKDAIDMIERIIPGRRNNFFKNLLRLYLMYPFSEYFFESKEDLKFFEDKLKVFRTGQREVRAGKAKRQGRNEELSSSASNNRNASTENNEKKETAKTTPQKVREFAADPMVNAVPEERSVEDTDQNPAPGETAAEDEDAIMAVFNGLL